MLFALICRMITSEEDTNFSRVFKSDSFTSLQLINFPRGRCIIRISNANIFYSNFNIRKEIKTFYTYAAEVLARKYENNTTNFHFRISEIA